MDGLREGLYHIGGAPRLVAEELGGGQRPDLGGLQEGVGPGDGMGRDKPGAGVHPLQSTRGCAHVKHAEKPSSIANMTPERLAEERLDYAEQEW